MCRSACISLTTSPLVPKRRIHQSSFTQSFRAVEYGRHDHSLRFPNLKWLMSRNQNLNFGIRASSDSNSEFSPPWTVTSAGSSLPTQQRSDVHLVLVSPQIPGNVGTIARTCAASLVGLHLIEPLGFQIDDTKLKRAGLDYWPYVVVKVHSSWSAFMDYFKEQEGPKRLIAFSKYGSQPHWDLNYSPGDWLLFGAETFGLPEEAVDSCRNGEWSGGVARIPIQETYVRSLNLAVAAGIGLYEALRQIDATYKPLIAIKERPIAVPLDTK